MADQVVLQKPDRLFDGILKGAGVCGAMGLDHRLLHPQHYGAAVFFIVELGFHILQSAGHTQGRQQRKGVLLEQALHLVHQHLGHTLVGL